MGKRQPLEFAGKAFATKTEATQYLRKLLEKYQVGEPFGKEDFEFMYQVLLMHPSADLKVACGVDSFRKEFTIYGTIGVILTRTDGSETDFSWVHCLTPKSALNDLNYACRTAIRPDIEHFREQYYQSHQDSQRCVPCALTGKPVQKSDCEVHHAHLSFETIFKAWLENLKVDGIDVSKIEVIGHGDGEMIKEIKDEFYKNHFRIFHRNHAVLQITVSHHTKYIRTSS